MLLVIKFMETVDVHLDKVCVMLPENVFSLSTKGMSLRVLSLRGRVLSVEFDAQILVSVVVAC